MLKQANKNSHRIPWKLYIRLTLESLLAFYIATLSLALFFIHKGNHWLVSGVILICLYLFVIYACAKRIFHHLSIAAIMLIIPIAPLIALIIIVTLLPILERLM